MDVCSLATVTTIPKAVPGAEAGAGSGGVRGWEWENELKKKRIIITRFPAMRDFSGYFHSNQPISLFCLSMDWPKIDGKRTSLPIPFEYQLFKYKFTKVQLDRAQEFFLSGNAREQSNSFCTGEKDCVIQALSFLFTDFNPSVDLDLQKHKIPSEMLQQKQIFQGFGTKSFSPNVITTLNLPANIKYFPNNSFFEIKLTKEDFPETKNAKLFALNEEGEIFNMEEAQEASRCGVTLIKKMFEKLYNTQLLTCDYKFILTFQYSWTTFKPTRLEKPEIKQLGHAVVGYFVKTDNGVEIGILDNQSGLEQLFYLCKGVGQNFNEALINMFSEENQIWKASFIVNSCIDIETIGTFTTNHLNSLFDKNFTTTTAFWNSYYESKTKALLDNRENNRMATQSALDLAQQTADPFEEVKLIQTDSLKITLCYFSPIFNQLIRDEVGKRLSNNSSEIDNTLITSEMVSNIYKKCFFSYLPSHKQQVAAYSFMDGDGGSRDGIWFIYQATKKIRGRRVVVDPRRAEEAGPATQLIILSMLWINLTTFVTRDFLKRLFPADIQALESALIYDIYNVCNNPEFTDAIKGICQKFISQVILYLISINCRVIGLHVRIGKGNIQTGVDLNEKNYAALKCYLKCGFRIIIPTGPDAGPYAYEIWPQTHDYIKLFHSEINFKEMIDPIIEHLVYDQKNHKIGNVFSGGGAPSNPDLNLRMIFGIGNEFIPQINLINYLPDVTLRESLQNLEFLYSKLESTNVNQLEFEGEKNAINSIGTYFLRTADEVHTFPFGVDIPDHLDLKKFITDFLERVQRTGSPEADAPALFLTEKLLTGIPFETHSLGNNTLQSLRGFFNTFESRQILYLILIYLAYKPLGGINYSSRHSGGNKFIDLTKQKLKKKNKTNKNKKYIKQTKNYKIVKKVKKFKKIKKSKKVKKLKKTNKQKKKY